MTVELLDKMGSDLTVVNAARVSFDKWATMVGEKDERLINYLAEHNHWSPFGHAVAQFRITAPIFVARQLVKHQVGLVWNEVSRRYVDSEPDFYVPSEWRMRAADKKQGSSQETIANHDAVMDAYFELLSKAQNLYAYMIKAGVAPEQARMVLPLSTETTWIWTGSLYAWARVCNLRLDPHAQAETREVAVGIDKHMGELFPLSWTALVNNNKKLEDNVDNGKVG